MKDRILEKYTGRNGDTEVETDMSVEADAADDLGSFGWLRGIRDRAVMLELRKKTGAIRAIPYSWIEWVDFEPSEGITLYVGGQKIRIKGRNLNTEAQPRVKLFEGLTRHKIPWLQEADQPTILKVDKIATLIEVIEW